jgi:hypothetical protein
MGFKIESIGEKKLILDDDKLAVSFDEIKKIRTHFDKFTDSFDKNPGYCLPLKE